MKDIFKKRMVVSGALALVLSFAPSSIAQCRAAAATHNRRFFNGLLTLILLFSAPTMHADETVTQIQGAPGHIVWKIDQPQVNVPKKDYPGIKFAPGQLVTVTATGCVQTGGSGHTWKRYVDPAEYGTESPLYHGQVSIPGATSGLVDFLPRTPEVFTIPANTSVAVAQMHLQLGYTDNGYSDNGYNNRNNDNGNMDQCWGLGDASIIIDIAPLPPTVAAPNEADYTFTIDSIMIRNPRTHHAGVDGTDTDVIGTSVMVNGTLASIAGETIGNVKRGSHSVNFPIVVTQVRPGDRLDFVDAVVNAGDPNSQATTTEVTGIIAKVASIVPGFGSALGAVVGGIGDVINLLNPDCDGPVVADSIPATGADLALWTQNGRYTRTIGFPGTNSNTGCGSNSFYEVTYSITRGATPAEYSLTVNVPSRVSKLGAQTRLFRK